MSALIVVAGPSGSGKTTVGRAVAESLGAVFLDADDYHLPAAIAKMREGTPLTDEDRVPWVQQILAALQDELQRGPAVVLACSALTTAVREALRAGVNCPVKIFFLDVPKAELKRRLEGRTGHFMPASLLESQLEATAGIGTDSGVLAVKSDRPVHAITRDIVGKIGQDSR